LALPRADYHEEGMERMGYDRHHAIVVTGMELPDGMAFIDDDRKTKVLSDSDEGRRGGIA